MSDLITRTHVLRLTYGTSRGAETYGWNIVTLRDETAGKRFRTVGGGYDMVGTVFGDWLEATHQDALRSIADQAYDRSDDHTRGLYGMKLRADGSIHLDGGCGLESMLRIARAAGLEVVRTADRKHNTTGWLVVSPDA